MAGENTIRKIEIKIDTKGSKELKDLADQMGTLNKGVDKIGGSLDSFKNKFNAALGFSVFGIGIKNLADMSDSIQGLENRITALSGSSKDTPGIINDIAAAAQRTKSPVGSLADTYARIAISTKELNLGSRAVVAITETLVNTFRISGSTAEEAANASVQFSQALALGVLRGQDFKSVLSQNAEFGNILTKSLGKTRGELQKMAEAGQLTAGTVLKALAGSMEETNRKAEAMGQTFSQSVTLGLNKITIAIGEVNKQLGASGLFAKGVDLIIEKFTLFLAVAGTVALTAIPFLIDKIVLLGKALTTLALDNPITAILIGIGLAILAVVRNFDELKEIIIKTFIAAEIYILKFLQIVNSVGDVLGSLAFGRKRDLSEAQAAAGSYQKIINDIQKAEADRNRTTLVDRKKLDDLESSSLTRAKSQLANVKSGEVPEDKRAAFLKKLNAEYDKGKLSIGEYFDKLQVVDDREVGRLFKEGKKDLEQLNEALLKTDLRDFTRDFNEGKISIREYNQSLEENTLEKFTDQLEAGKISLIEYDEALVKISSKFESGSSFRVGAENYIKGIGTLSQQISGLVTSTFTRLEDTFVEFTKTGKANFKEFAQAVLDDLNRIIIRSLIIRPLAAGILDNIGSSASNTSPSSGGGTNYLGANTAFDKYASGGIVNSPTFFSYGTGRKGLAGEAGPEAIIPLKRGANGDLGISGGGSNVQVNIVNNTGGEVRQSESVGPDGSRVIDILIQSKVKEGIANGSFDRTFQQAYGLNRRGV